MITSAENAPWPSDVAVSDRAAAGLPIPSVVRTAKLDTVDASLAEPIGWLPTPDRPTVARHLAGHPAAALKPD